MSLKILVVDDDFSTCISINDYLELCGYEVMVAGDGEKALAIAESNPIDLIVTDIIMPRMNGYELVRRLRQNPNLGVLPVILLTARNQTQERILGYESGCDLYLPKPFELEELGAAIRNLLKRSQFLQSVYQESGHDELNSEQKSRETLLPEPFTKREREVLSLLCQGLSNADMGRKLHLSPRTVEKYVSSLLHKTNNSNRSQLVRFAIQHGLVE